MQRKFVAKKSLGQHFLRSERALSTIVDESDAHFTDIILEIGPGEGVLTERLLRLGAKVVAVEKDDNLFEKLKIKFAGYLNQNLLDLVHGDILNFDPNVLRFYKDLTYKIVANIPYNITGAILQKFLSNDNQPERMVLLVQKEVAERIVAKNGKESILSISVKAYGMPHYVERVLAGSFVPAPRVDSAIISINGISKGFFDGFDQESFFKMLKTGFSAKRKKLSSNLAKVYAKSEVEEMMKMIGLDPNIRAEDLKLGDWQKLAQRLCIRAK